MPKKAANQVFVEGTPIPASVMTVTTTNSSPRDAHLESLYADLDKVAPGAGRPLAEQRTEPLERIPTSSPSLNYILGGGMPTGRICEIYGAESGGKTTLTLDVMAQAQRAGGRVLFVDAEHSLDLEWAARLGVDVNTLHYDAPDSGEEALKIVEIAVKSGLFKVIVVDSVSALVPEAEIKGEMGEAHMGLQARLMSQGMRKLAGIIDKHEVCVIFINQLREKIGVMFGSPETTSGGRALKFYASIRLDVRRGELLKEGENTVGAQIKVKCIKNKTATPLRRAIVSLDFERGIDGAGELLDTGVDFGLFTKKGAWYNYGEQRMGQGRSAACQWLRDNPTVMQDLLPKVAAALATGEIAA